MAVERKCTKLAARVVEFQKEFVALPDNDCQWAIEHPKEFIELAVQATKNRASKPFKKTASPKVLAGILKEVGEPFKCPAEQSCFIAREKFVVNVNGELPISGMGQNFIDNFLDLVEENVPAMTVRQRKLLKSSVDKPILAALGDMLEKIERARVHLAHMFHFLKTADRSKWFVFYVADKSGTVWAVRARWSGGGWFVEANSVRDPSEWGGGGRVVSR